MTDLLPSETLIVQALKSNLADARHFDRQRLQTMAVYVAVTLGLGYGAIYAAVPAVRILASELGFCLTLAFWGLTNQLNAAFARQIAYAIRCSELLVVDHQFGARDLSELMGIPRGEAAPRSRRVTVGLMFHLIYAAFALNWLLLFGYSVLRLIFPEAAL